jgi:ribosomal protein L40E
MPENVNTRICSSCQAETDADAIFCNECGAMQTKSTNNAATNGRNNFEADKPLEIKHASGSFSDSRTPLKTNTESKIFSTKPQLKENSNSSKSKSNSQEKSFSPNTVSAVTKRYRDGYRVAGASDGFGQLIKAIGVLSGLGIGLLGLIVSAGAAEQARQSSFGLSDGGGIAFGSILFSESPARLLASFFGFWELLFPPKDKN